MDDIFFEARRRTLRIILVLSIIGSGFSLFGNLLTGLAFPTLKMMYETGAMTFPEEMTIFMERIFSIPRPYFLCSALLYGISLAGVIMMWNLKKSGFHLYTIARLLVLLVTTLFLGREYVALGDIMFTLLFVVFYYISLRNLGVFHKATEEEESSE